MNDGSPALPAVWVDGERLSTGRPHISALDRGFLLADGVFETLRAYGGVVFRLDAHLARLEHALATLEISVPPEMRAWVHAAVRAVDLEDMSVRLTVTRGVAATGGLVPRDASSPPTVVVTVSALPALPARTYHLGLSAHVASGRRNERAMTAGLKTIAYTDAVAALLEARRAGADEALLLDTEDHCSEASASNLFAVLRGTLVTPPLACGVLPGITRATVLELAPELGIAAEERAFRLDELLDAEEAFLTSSLRQLAPLVRVGRHAIGPGIPGAITRELMAAYDALVSQECRVGVARPRP